MEELELISFKIISEAGDATASYLKAIDSAEKNDFKRANEFMSEGNLAINEAHKIQTKLIQNEINGDKQKYDLLLIHAQDHLMNAILLKNLMSTIITLYERISKNDQISS